MSASGSAAATTASRDEWAGRFDAQALACDALGSPLYARLLALLADEIRAGRSTWDVLAPHAGLRFGQAGPLRLVGAAHRLALRGEVPAWAALLPSCGGTVSVDDDELLDAWRSLVDAHAEVLDAGLRREVQTNEVGRAAALALGAARVRTDTGAPAARVVELGCSGGLNLRLDRFRTELRRVDGPSVVLGDPDSTVRLAPDVVGPVPAAVKLPEVLERVGIDVAPIDPATADGAATLVGFLWPDQLERVERTRAAIALAADHPADLIGTDDTAGALEALLAAAVPTIVAQSIMWQYVPTDTRWHLTSILEAAGAAASNSAPLAWLRYEPDEWNRTRAALWLRTWPGGCDRLLAHVDYHGRWVAPVAAP